ncbi:MAG: hypothetical protein KC546_21260 [Anaerolineae bacterium]|nr:hypothetical protein [Anaerolineae bacterium]
MQSTSNKRPPSNVILMQALRFDPRDLAANREGNLSQRQITRLQPPRIQGLAFWVMIGHVAVIFAVLGMIAIISQQGGLLLVAVIAAGMTGMPMMMVRDQKFMRPDLGKDVQKGVVKSVCGMTTRHTDPDKKRNYYITVDETTFEVTSKMYGGFFQEGNYCVYYLPRSRTIVSAERLSD